MTFCASGLSVLPAAPAAAPPNAAWFPEAPSPPEPAGKTILASSVEELFQAAKQVQPGGTILVADGHYSLPRLLAITTNNVTLRGQSGKRHQVILDGGAIRHGELIGITGAAGVTIADLTVQNVKWNGIKINSDRGADKVTIHNCVLHNVWQRGVKAPAMPEQQSDHGPRHCRIQFCLFYNDRAKQFSDDETDTAESYNGNYIGGIDAKNTTEWTISDNVFIGIQGRTREGRGCIYISENGRGCVIERNIFIDCDIAIALGNPSLGYSPLQAIDCVARNNFVTQCPETGILACYTRNCQILNNTVVEPKSRMRRLIWVQKSNEGLRVENNLLIGAPPQIARESSIVRSGNIVGDSLTETKMGRGQSFLSPAAVAQAIEFSSKLEADRKQAAADRLKPGVQRPEVLAAMRQVHAGFNGQSGYVAQFGDSITHSMAFWTPMGWDEPQRYLTHEDGLPNRPEKMRWRDYVKGTRDKGPEHANDSGWRVGQVLKAMDGVLEKQKPEAAIIMVGTNDISSGRVPEGYRAGLEEIVSKCLASHCVPILNTLPPRRGHDQAVDDANKIIREIAREKQIPLADFHAACLRVRSGNSWDGTIISDDGVHPSGGESNNYSEENLKQCGYALRNWINFLVYRQLYFRIFAAEP
ncbi:GDSL-type esterase/lipase family protein [Rhodopirellula sp. JC639]|uniref:GDSL-type esterase/lipase family protein n=1 Tax=Stieleria mannarensis TaxID=2755585 RepID=UPI0015FEF249|nr:GDSL-type esterase/lipase family protein [Rhodopirellula sp. JC639]